MVISLTPFFTRFGSQVNLIVFVGIDKPEYIGQF
ncbi:hypothetical protein C8N44_1206 [Allosediminivita pacifica]|uniref:Uncharacterized protein n=1 Tax=Allosediminivita pacifica TaxID=1267769 RepID=A0A2T6AP96_9RHOB|nr:hypothetical protein C8N44_1206 [Allosediminivita pacifica]